MLLDSSPYTCTFVHADLPVVVSLHVAMVAWSEECSTAGIWSQASTHSADGVLSSLVCDRFEARAINSTDYARISLLLAC